MFSVEQGVREPDVPFRLMSESSQWSAISPQ